MKKFMTLLLVVSVLFTFSFSSAFAAVSVDEAGMNAVLEQQEKMAEAVNKYAAEEVVYGQNGYVYSPAGFENVPKAAVEAAVAEVIATLNQAILEKEIELVATVTEWTDAETNALAAVWAGSIKDKVFADKEDNALYTVAVETYAAAFSAKVEAVNPEAYAEAEKTVVEQAVKEAKTALEKPAKSATGLAALVTAEGKFDLAMKDKLTAGEQEAKLEEVKAKAIEAVKKAYDDYYKLEEKDLKDIIEAVTDPTAVAKATADLAVLGDNVDKVEAMYVAKIEAVVISKDLAFEDAKLEVAAIESAAKADASDLGIAGVIGKFANVDLLVKYAESMATALKTQYDTTTGLANFNAATVDKALAEIVAGIEALKITSYTEIDTEVGKIPTAKAEKDALALKVTQGVKDITEGTYAADLWEKDNKDAVEAIQKDYTAQIKAAATADEITELVKAAQKAMDAYLTKTQTKTVTDAVQAKVEALEVDKALKAYANGIAAKNSGAVYTEAIKDAAVVKAIDVFKDAAVALQDVKVASDSKALEAIIDANYEAALAVIDGMKTADELKVEKEAVVAAIKALPTTATLENKAEFLAAKDMMDAYLKNAGALETDVTNYSLLKSQLTKIVRLEKEAVEAMIKALPKTITLADKEAVEAADAAAKAYKEAYEEFPGYVALTLTDLEADQAALSNVMMLEAAKLIAALPAEITEADAAAVAAARAAYDALSKEDKATFDVASKALVEKLEAAEEALAAVTAYTDADAKAYVQDLKIVARSAKTAKGSVKVTINADVEELIENGYTVEYKFYRSTKSNAKFGTAKKVSEENVYTNTTGKKGVKYFYKAKLVVKNAEGEVVATTPLTQCRYACRTWSK